MTFELLRAHLGVWLDLTAGESHIRHAEGINRGCIDEALSYLAGINAEIALVVLLGLLIRAQKSLPGEQALTLVPEIGSRRLLPLGCLVLLRSRLAVVGCIAGGIGSPAAACIAATVLVLLRNGRNYVLNHVSASIRTN